jgi:hypothetical protein
MEETTWDWRKGRLMETRSGRFDALVGRVISAGLVAGTAGLIFALVAVLTGQWVGAGACLAAAGLSFGLLANAILRE